MTCVRDLIQKVLPRSLRRTTQIDEPIVVRGGPHCHHAPEARKGAGTLTNPWAFLCKDCGRYIASGQESITTKEG